MSERSVVQLFERKTSKLVEATLIDGVSREDVEKVEASWRPFIDKEVERMKAQGKPQSLWPQHQHWDWRKKHEFSESYLAFRMFGIECATEIQGLMMVSTTGNDCRIDSQKGKPLIYVEFLAAAPWNLASIVAEPRYSLVGSVLIAAAILLSKEEEFQGRIGLHSLPQAAGWYRDKCKMADLGVDPAKKPLRYFEMTPKQASEFLGEVTP